MSVHNNYRATAFFTEFQFPGTDGLHLKSARRDSHAPVRGVIQTAHGIGDRHLSTNSDTSMTASRAYSVTARSCPRSVVFLSAPNSWQALNIASPTNPASAEALVLAMDFTTPPSWQTDCIFQAEHKL